MFSDFWKNDKILIFSTAFKIAAKNYLKKQNFRIPVVPEYIPIFNVQL